MQLNVHSSGVCKDMVHRSFTCVLVQYDANKIVIICPCCYCFELCLFVEPWDIEKQKLVALYVHSAI